ncbi:phage major capsid protein [Bosea sp. (in: a-proteobacteria)]|uniref:phage major capsid protein n=1 Tax=Bosea sp. (in: a-proteobacteria) TaxID=1871050 RepID=UPI001ACEAB3B|nr:phage major capsid protein [Bosea sp. (in: a-proteobacteria)]MBN9437025.1 phage major capsid protein [Bosea sp. (in: a-proteobacteria)]
MSERLEIKAALAVDETGVITGTAWDYNTPDRVGDVIVKGAIGDHTRLPMLFAHDQRDAVGVWESITETDAGLTVKGRLLVDDVARAREVRALVQAGAVNGLSIGFISQKATARARGGRTISKLDLHEISIVAVPCHPGATITSMKAATDGPANQENHMDPAENTETKEAPAFDQKAFDALAARLDKMEAKANRLPASNDNQANDNIILKAFESLLRFGERRMQPDEMKALTVASDASAGYLAPTEYGSEILKKLVEFSPVRQYARVVTVGARDIKYPRKVSGAAAVWVDETEDRTASTMVYEQVTITPHELATYTDISNALLEDNAYDLRGELVADFGEAFGKAEASAFVTGNGTGKPKGIMAAAGISVVKTGNAATLGSDPASTIIGLYHSLPQAHAQNAVWLMNRKTLAALRSLKDTTGRFLLADPISAGAATTLLGRPIVEAIDMADVGTAAFPILFGDLQGYRIINRLDLNILPDPYTLATKGQVRFNARARVGADVTHPDRFVKLQCAV